MERLKAAYTATAIAEYFRDQGRSVLLMMDSVTRFGRAQREIGLAAGEPPTRRGFPPSVFSELPKLMERAGNSDKGSITALYTVLVEGDDMTEPIADETRSILDGHIVLSRKLAAANHYPAIDVQASVSRVMNAIVSREHKQAAQALRAILAKHAEVELLVQIGEYKRARTPRRISPFPIFRPSMRFSDRDLTRKATLRKPWTPWKKWFGRGFRGRLSSAIPACRSVFSGRRGKERGTRGGSPGG